MAQQCSWSVTLSNDRAFMLRLAAEANRRWSRGRKAKVSLIVGIPLPAACCNHWEKINESVIMKSEAPQQVSKDILIPFIGQP